jgi:hypothetical protein
MAQGYVDCDGHVMERIDEIAELIGGRVGSWCLTFLDCLTSKWSAVVIRSLAVIPQFFPPV